MEKMIHALIQNMGTKIDSGHIKKAKRVEYITYIDQTRKMKNKLLHFNAKVKDISMEKNFNFSDVHIIQAPISLRTPIFENPPVKGVTPLMSYLKNINKRLMQKITKVKSPRDDKQSNSFHAFQSSSADWSSKDKIATFSRKIEPLRNTGNNLSKEPQTCRDDDQDIINGASEEEISKEWERDRSTKAFSKDLWWIHRRKRTVGSCNSSDNLTQYTEKKNELNEKYLSLHSKDQNFVRNNLHVTLYISNKDKKTNNFRMTKSRSQQVQLLCKHAILTLIEPSKNATVHCQESLSTAMQKHLEDGCKFHFNLPSNYDDYWALLVLSHWVGLLVRHPDSTLIRTISYALGCSSQKILVLAYSDDDS